MKNNEIFDVLDRVAPHGPEPRGWAALARKRNIQRRAATGIAAVALTAVLVIPVVGQLSDRSVPTVLSTPTPSVDEGIPMKELPQDCPQFTGVPESRGWDLAEVVEGFYCFTPREDVWTSAQLTEEELLSLVGHIAEESEQGDSAPMATQVGHLYFVSESGAAMSVTQDTEGSFWWRNAAGMLMVWHPSGAGAAEVEGTLATMRVIRLRVGVCWQDITVSLRPIDEAISGVLCDPTGSTTEEVEQEIPQELVTQILEQATATWVPITNDLRRGSGRSVILLDEQGRAFHLNQLTDGSMTWHQPGGSDLQWTPSGGVAEALTDLGMKYLQP